MSMMTKMYMNLRKGVWMVEWCVGGSGFQKGCIVVYLTEAWQSIHTKSSTMESARLTITNLM